MDIHWLQQQFDAVTEVKIAAPQPNSTVIFQQHSADLVVQTWLGSTLHLYLLAKAPRLRDLRGILKENTRSGIGTLFLVAAALLPEPARQFHILDWQEGLKGLSEGCIFGFTPQGRIHQVHFNPTPLAEQYTTWHFTDFQVEHVSVRKRDITTGLKGAWFLGDIVSPAYKRRINYERLNQRYHYTTRETPREAHPLPADTLTRYYQLLGLERSASEKEVKAAFRRLALNVHPDVSALPRQEAERRINELLRAYEFIKDYHGWS